MSIQQRSLALASAPALVMYEGFPQESGERGTILWRESPHLHAARFFPTALLSQMASADTRVPSQAVRAFHDRLAPYYLSAPERLRLIEYPHVDHDLCEEDWIQVRQNLVAWFERFLIGEDHV
jgi:hypothetical protein